MAILKLIQTHPQLPLLILILGLDTLRFVAHRQINLRRNARKRLIVQR